MSSARQERDMLLDVLRAELEHPRPLGKQQQMGQSSLSLIVSSFTGDPPFAHPWDEGDMSGLQDTMDHLPQWLLARARPVFAEQVRQYRAYRSESVSTETEPR